MRLSRALRSRAPAEYVPRTPLPSSVSGTAAYRRLEAQVKADNDSNKPGWYSLPKPDFSLHHGVPPMWSPAQANAVLKNHHKQIVDDLNDACFGSEYESMPLDVVIHTTSFDATRVHIHQRACEHFNHSFAWKGIKPWGVSSPTSAMLEALDLQLASPGAPLGSAFRDVLGRFEQEAEESIENPGWVYFVLRKNVFDFLVCPAGQSPITVDVVPLAVINTQYHAFYLDYGHQRRSDYIRNAIKAIDWNVAARNWSLAATEGSVQARA